MATPTAVAVAIALAVGTVVLALLTLESALRWALPLAAVLFVYIPLRAHRRLNRVRAELAA
ncbi:hypothetical protein [Actinomadura flavalba]|uniref:hypothetical protein n=1 Tax=Actinomadura flavalba TaxID=1120938 RepID=UPI00035CABB6|nr:hypothetical protein [Actinomadura flavalba]